MSHPSPTYGSYCVWKRRSNGIELIPRDTLLNHMAPS